MFFSPKKFGEWNMREERGLTSTDRVWNTRTRLGKDSWVRLG